MPTAASPASCTHPCLGETFTAVRGAGALCNGAPIAVSACGDLSRSLIGTGFSYSPAGARPPGPRPGEILPRVRDVRRAGSAAIDLAWVACGRLDGYYELGTRHWDRAAGVLLVAEAGGVVSRCRRSATAATACWRPAPACTTPSATSSTARCYTDMAFRSRR